MAATSPHVHDLARLLPVAGQSRSMGPMANPHNLAPPGTVFVHGTTQDYGDRGSNMPHLKLQLRALGLLDTGLRLGTDN